MAAATIGVTPIILAYLLVRGKATADEIVRASYRASRILNRASIRVDAVFRRYGDGDVRSESVDGELSYWLSSGLIRAERDGDRLVYRVANRDVVNLDSLRRTYERWARWGDNAAVWLSIEKAATEAAADGVPASQDHP